jgi:hypothetical protein
MTQTKQPGRYKQKVSTYLHTHTHSLTHSHTQTRTHICVSLYTYERDRGTGPVTDVESGGGHEENEERHGSEDTYIVVV